MKKSLKSRIYFYVTCVYLSLLLLVEKEVARITKNLTEELSEKERLKNSEKELFSIRDELSDVREKLANTEIELGKAQTENRALTKHGKVRFRKFIIW